MFLVSCPHHVHKGILMVPSLFVTDGARVTSTRYSTQKLRGTPNPWFYLWCFMLCICFVAFYTYMCVFCFCFLLIIYVYDLNRYIYIYIIYASVYIMYIMYMSHVFVPVLYVDLYSTMTNFVTYVYSQNIALLIKSLQNMSVLLCTYWKEPY